MRYGTVTHSRFGAFTSRLSIARVDKIPDWSKTLPAIGPNLSFGLALEKIFGEHGGNWTEFSRDVGIHQRTIREWRRGRLPSETKFREWVERLILRKALPVSAIQELELSYIQAQSTFAKRERQWHIVEQNVFSRLISQGRPYSTLNLPPPPPPPSQTTPGPTLTPTLDGFDIEPRPLLQDERSNPDQISLYKRLQTMANRLQTSMPGISNTHPALVQEFDDYRAFLAPDLASLDLTSLWSVGTGLSEHVRALDQTGGGTMTPELEPDIKAHLRTLMTTHIAFILGFPQGLELQDRVHKGREAAEANPGLQGKTEAVLEPMESKPNLLAFKAVRIVRALLRGLRVRTTIAFDLLTSSAEMARNSVFAFIKVLHPILIAGDAATFTLNLAGYEHAEVLRAAATFLHENHQSIAVLFVQDQQVTDWLVWAMQRMRVEVLK